MLVSAMHALLSKNLANQKYTFLIKKKNYKYKKNMLPMLTMVGHCRQGVTMTLCLYARSRFRSK